MSEKEKSHHLVNLGEESQLKIDLNEGIASLQKATESQFQPHICLNKKEGVEVIKKISQNPKQANTQFLIRELIIRSQDDMWLNINFLVFLDKICFPDNVANLSPRQTGYIVKNLPVESQKIVLDKIKAWYSGKFLEEIKKGIETITKQFDKGNPLIDSDDGNRIFDIHGGRSMDVPYTELNIIGEELFWPLFCGITLFDHNQDGYKRVDGFLTNIDNQRESAVDSVIGLMKALK